MGKIPQISESEWEVMKVVWDKEGLTATDIVACLAATMGCKDATIRTLIRRLVAKGALQYQVDPRDKRIFYYYPLVSREEATKKESKHFLQRVFNGAGGLMLASFIRKADLSDQDIREIEKALQEKREEHAGRD